MGKTNIPKITYKKSNSSNLQKYNNIIKILEKMIINTYYSKETE